MPPSPARRYSSRKRHMRLKRPLIFAGLTVLGILGLWLCAGQFEPEPLTTEQILEKSSWSEEELTDTLSRQIALRGNLRGNPEVLKHLQTEVNRLPKENQKRIRDNTLRKSILYAQEQYATLPSDQRQKVVDNLVNRLKQQQKNIKNMTPEERAKLKERLDDPAIQDARKNSAQSALDRLTPEMRNELAPLVKEWVNVLESI